MYITTRGPDGGGLYAAQMPFGITGMPEPEAEVQFKQIPADIDVLADID